MAVCWSWRLGVTLAAVKRLAIVHAHVGVLVAAMAVATGSVHAQDAGPSQTPAGSDRQVVPAEPAPAAAPDAGAADPASQPTSRPGARPQATPAGAAEGATVPADAAEQPAASDPAIELDPALPEGIAVPAPPDPSAREFASPEAQTAGTKIVYVLERIEIVGNRTRDAIIRRFVPLAPGDLLDVDDPAIERIRWRLMGTGWFNDVRLRLTRGSERGRVVLVIEVKERNTLVISRVIAGLARVVTSSSDSDDDLRPYAGIGLAENNLLGLGIGIGATVVLSEAQKGFELRYSDPMRMGGGFDLTGRAFYNDARDFFGREPTVTIDCPPADDPEDPEPCDPDVAATRAVVIYDRFGIGLGTGHDITGSLRYELDWLGEVVDVQARPAAARTLLGEEDQEVAPIDFHIDDGTSRVSTLHIGLVFDRRDDPALPSKGQLLRIDTRLGAEPIGSTYDFVRIEAAFRHFQPLPWGHVVSFGVFAGTVFGRAPFFYRFYAADLSDLVPSRALELNLDHRRTHNLLGTSIQEFDKEDLAARVDFEYELPLHRGGGDIRGIDAYAGAGLFFLADRLALRRVLPGYEGLERAPVDLTFDLGVQADTALGVFKVGFSSLIGFLPDLGQSP
jgi:hypothetical protein